MTKTKVITSTKVIMVSVTPVILNIKIEEDCGLMVKLNLRGLSRVLKAQLVIILHCLNINKIGIVTTQIHKQELVRPINV